MKKRLFALLTVLVLLAAVPGITALGEAAQEWENMREYVYTFREEVKMEGKTVPMVIDYIDDEEAREREFTVCTPRRRRTRRKNPWIPCLTSL